MITETDLEYLREAVSLAERGLFTTTPNPRVGCVIVRHGRVLGRGWHAWCGEAHAEINAIRDAGGDVAGATVYVSLEPCTVDGRTPPCVEALISAGVQRVVAGAPDPDPRVNGSGFERLCAAGIETENANLAGALRLNAGHRQRIAHGRPLIRIKMAASLDGRTAMASGESQWITGAAARRDVQYWRARSCAVVTGIGTVLADDPRLNVRDGSYAVDGRLRPPLRVIADSRMRTPPHARLFAEDGPVLIAHAGSPDLEHGNAESVKCGDGRVNLRELVGLLADRPCNEVLVEAGPTLAGAMMEEKLWDELVLYLAPRLLGKTARPLIDREIERLGDAVSGRIEECVQVGEDLRLRLARED
ncbi:MAG: bifunctional diaminohydroxyphosphoribosylaminopyrimidine deaminase/5-amino-6-(5-phosphoribosylamino)uracil reductase RibD [Gammaproteobacteria bacterium]|nr:bifunctional diaminohydroxyphosphoribosylaminopyrimidine deaminase/5-amino-6-(5-phosphoribosylamino)uracil reductase RibD [Gammaproteobacteria bacterium]